MISTEPLVSIVVPAYNAGRTLSAALASACAQTYRHTEIIVVDDGSTDDTAQVLAEWRDRVTVLSQANAGPARARNRALAAASGELIAFLDADDVWLPRKLERQVSYFQKHPETGFLHSGTLVTTRPTRAACEAADNVPLDYAAPAPRPSFDVVFHCDVDINTLTVMAPRAVLEEAGGFDERRELHVEDWDLWIRIAARHPVGYIPLPLAVHRAGGGMSSASEKTYVGQELVIRKSAPLCANACARHRGDSVACVRDRLRRLFRERGYHAFWSGRAHDAREAFGRALRLGFSARAAAYYAVSFAGSRPFEGVRRAIGRAHSEAASVPLVHDTIVRRARAATARTVHRVDDRVGRLGHDTGRILFEAASPLSLAVFRPVLERLRQDPRLDFWFTSCDRSWDARRIFTEAGLAERVVTPAQARWMKFDAYVNTDFWNMTWLPRRTRRVHLFHGVAGKYGLDAPVRIAPVVATFDRLMFTNRDRLKRYADAGLVDAESARAALVGYPKVDCLVDGSLDRASIQSDLGLDRSAPTVLYAPTWSPHSSLQRMGGDIIRGLGRLGVNVIVKLHDRSYDAATRASGGIDWKRHLDGLCRAWNVRLVDDADISRYLLVADALVTDHSSVGFEFMLLDRPLVVVDCPDLLTKARVNPHKASLLRSAADVVREAGDVSSAVTAALASPARRSTTRRTIAADLFYCPGGAAARAAQCIYDVLSLPAPATLDAAAHAGVAPPFSSVEPRTT